MGTAAPVLTAHPTEVQRKSTLDGQMAIARMLDQRDRMALTPEERDESDELLRSAVLTLIRGLRDATGQANVGPTSVPTRWRSCRSTG